MTMKYQMHFCVLRPAGYLVHKSQMTMNVSPTKIPSGHFLGVTFGDLEFWTVLG